MDKPFPENIKDIRTAVMASEVREGIAQGMEYVEQFASTATTKAAEAAASAKTAADAASNASTAVSAAIDPTLSLSGKAADAAKVGEAVGKLNEDITNINNLAFTQSQKLWCPNGIARERYITSTFSGFATSWEITKKTYVVDLNFKVCSRADANITAIRVRIENADFVFEKSFTVDIGHELTDVKIEVNHIIPDGVVWIGIAANQIFTFAHDSDTDKHYIYWTDGSLDKLSQLKETGDAVASLYLIASVLNAKFIDKVKTDNVIDGAITQKKLSFTEYRPPKNLFNYASEETCKIGYWYYSVDIGSILTAEKNIYTESKYTAIKVDVSSVESIIIDSPDKQIKTDIQYTACRNVVSS